MAKTLSERMDEVADRIHKGAFSVLRTMQADGLTLWECKAVMALAQHLLNWTPTNKAYDLDVMEQRTAGKIAADMIRDLSGKDD